MIRNTTIIVYINKTHEVKTLISTECNEESVIFYKELNRYALQYYAS